MASVAFLVLRLAVAAVFAVAGAAKLVDRDGSRRALRGFGVAGRLTSSLAWLLPAGEIAIAAALVPGASARAAAAAAAAMLVLFAVAIAVALLRGHRPDCHCFGQLHSAPAGLATLGRNVLLTGVTAAVAVRGPGMSLSAVDPLAAAATATIGLVVLQSIVLVALLRRHGRALVQVDAIRDRGAPPEENGLSVGAPAPPFALESVTGELVSLDDLLAPGLPLLLTFVDRGCGPCAALLPEIAGWQDKHADRLTVAIIGRGEAEENRATAEEHDLSLLLVDSGDVAATYGSAGTPSALVVAPDGRLASPLSYGSNQIRALIADQCDPEPEPELVHV